MKLYNSLKAPKSKKLQMKMIQKNKSKPNQRNQPIPKSLTTAPIPASMRAS